MADLVLGVTTQPADEDGGPYVVIRRRKPHKPIRYAVDDARKHAEGWEHDPNLYLAADPARAKRILTSFKAAITRLSATKP